VGSGITSSSSGTDEASRAQQQQQQHPIQKEGSRGEILDEKPVTVKKA